MEPVATVLSRAATEYFHPCRKFYWAALNKLPHVFTSAEAVIQKLPPGTALQLAENPAFLARTVYYHGPSRGHISNLSHVSNPGTASASSELTQNSRSFYTPASISSCYILSPLFRVPFPFSVSLFPTCTWDEAGLEWQAVVSLYFLGTRGSQDSPLA